MQFRINPQWLRGLALGAALLLAASAPLPTMAQAETATARTWYVRPDGGSEAQCSGLVNAPYPGSGVGQPCAWDHPFRALPPGGPARIAGGDTLLIGAGSYQMGYGAPGASACSSDYPWDCFMCPIPSGPDAAHPTRILGAGSETGCAAPPELWGTERAQLVVNLAASSYVEVSCLEITDHSSCVEFHSGGLACTRDTYPFGDWAATGLYAEDAANVTLRHLNIHGLAEAGVRAGRLRDWLVEDVRIAANGWVGWEGDLGGPSSNAGTLTFRRWVVEWNGCGETWPGKQPSGCWAQSAGGYGDGVGTGETAGHWVIEDSAFRYNTSDGLDLLYARAGSLIEIRRTTAVGNAGNQIKTNGPTLLENCVIVGNCGYFQGQPFTYDVDNCRAAGNALSLDLRAGDRVTVTHCTLASEGDCLVVAGCYGCCLGTEVVTLRNNLFQGHPDFLSDDLTCLAYQEDFAVDPFRFDYSLINGVKHDACPGAHALCGQPVGVLNEGIDTFDGHLRADSPAIGAADAAWAPAEDHDGRRRDARPDIGAYEYPVLVPVLLPLVRGWNLISLPVEPPQREITLVLATIAGRYASVYAYEASDALHPWKSYLPAAPQNDLALLTPQRGYWIEAASAVTLTLTGTAITTASVPLVPGWNLVGYPSGVTRPLTVALSTISGSYGEVYAYLAAVPTDPWRFYDAAAPPYASTLTALVPGLGYWVRAAQACTWRLGE
jgi:hypothetical protein